MNMRVELNNYELREGNALTRECLRCDELIFVNVNAQTGLIVLTSQLCSTCDSKEKHDIKVTLFKMEVEMLQKHLRAGIYQKSDTVKIEEQNKEMKEMEQLRVAQDAYIGQLISDDIAQYKDALSVLPEETAVESAEWFNANATSYF